MDYRDFLYPEKNQSLMSDYNYSSEPIDENEIISLDDGTLNALSGSDDISLPVGEGAVPEDVGGDILSRLISSDDAKLRLEKAKQAYLAEGAEPSLGSKAAGIIAALGPSLIGALVGGKQGAVAAAPMGMAGATQYFKALGETNTKAEKLAALEVEDALKDSGGIDALQALKFIQQQKTAKEDREFNRNNAQDRLDLEKDKFEFNKSKRDGDREIAPKEIKEFSLATTSLGKLKTLRKTIASDVKNLKDPEVKSFQSALKTYTDTLTGKDKGFWSKAKETLGLSSNEANSSRIEEIAFDRAIEQLNPNSTEALLFQELRNVARLRARSKEVGVLTEQDVRFYYDMMTPKLRENTSTFLDRFDSIIAQDQEELTKTLEDFKLAGFSQDFIDTKLEQIKGGISPQIQEQAKRLLEQRLRGG